MQEFTIGDVGVFIGTIGGVVTSILIVLQKSKCKNIKCCGASCDRKIPDEELFESLNFVKEGTLRDKLWRNRKWYDSHIYSKLVTDK